jgi:hypothetical protein
LQPASNKEPVTAATMPGWSGQVMVSTNSLAGTLDTMAPLGLL